MIIRRFEPSDIDQVVDLWHVCGLVAPQNDPVKDINRKMRAGGELFLVGEIDSRVVATAMGGYDGHRGWVNYLAVLPSLRSNGYGRDLMKVLEDKLKAVGCPKINLQVRGTNKQVVEFYESLGYGMDQVVSMGKRLEFD